MGAALTSALIVGLAPTFAPTPALARQIASVRSAPVYMDDSPRAVDGLIRALELSALGNHDEAVRVLQTLLTSEGDRVIAAREDPDLFTSVRSRVMHTLLSDKKLLDRYRDLQTPEAARLLEAGAAADVEHDFLLTTPGYEAALRVAQRHIEQANFAAARLTLLQLDRHPDRSAERAVAAAEMLSTVAAHIGAGQSDVERERLREIVVPEAQRSREAAGLGPLNVEDAQEPSVPVERTPYAPADFELDISQLLPRPLWSDSLGDQLPLVSQPSSARQMNAPPEDAAWLFVRPTVVGDSVYVNNSETISAWNRFTLAPRWRVKLQGPVQATTVLGGQRHIEELSTIEVHDGIAVCLTGLRIQSNMVTERMVIAIEAQTGRPLWNRRLEDFKDAGLEDSAIRGPVIVSQGQVIFGIEKDISRRRLESYYLVALDLRTGDLQWSRPVGSSGSQNVSWRPVVSDALVAHGGVTYIGSRIGFIAAIESATGRPLWIRRMEVTAVPNQRADFPWEANISVVAGERLYTLSPSRTELLCLDIRTGDILARRSAAEFNTPDYLLYAEGWLLAVSPATIDAVEATDLAEGPIRRAVSLNSGGPMRGRVCVLGDHLLIPGLTEVQLHSLSAMGQGAVARVQLDRPGATLPLEGQLLVVDDQSIHTYLVWSVAEKMLRDRMEAAADDPEPAVTYAELAYRAGRPQLVAPAIDRALAAMERDPLAPDMQAIQTRIFRSIHQMVEPPPDAPALTELSDALRGELIDRLGQSASTSADRVAYLLTAGRHQEGVGNPALAVQMYQAVLDDPDLLAASYSSGGTTVGADFETTRRLRRVIQLHGRGLYDAYEADASRLLTTLGPDTREPEAFEAIARRYPLSKAAVSAWAEAGTRHAAQRRPQLAALAFEEGLAAARDALGADDPLFAELAGRLVQSLVRAELLYPAQATLERLLAERPDLSMTEGGSALDARVLLASISARLTQGEPRARIGPAPTDSTALQGWVIEPPDAADAVSQAPAYVLMRSEHEEIAMFKSVGPGPLKQLWAGVRNDIYLWMDRTGVIFSVESGEQNKLDVAFVKRDLETGKELWRTPNFRALHTQSAVDELLERAPDQQIPEIDTPLRARARVTEVLYTYDDRTLIALDRVGRAAAFDLETGATLWTRSDLMPRVHGAAARSGVLVIGGSDAPVDLRSPLRDTGNLGTSGVVLAVDSRGGQTIHRAETGGRVRWVRMAPEGSAIVGLDRGVLALDVFRKAVRWRAESRNIHETTAAWVFPGRAIVRRDDGRLWHIRTTDGFVQLKPIDTRDRLESNFRSIRLTALGEKAGLATHRGLALYDRDSKLLGIDFRETSGAILFGGWGEKYVATLDSAGESNDEGLLIHHLNIYEADSLRAVSRTGLTLGSRLDSQPMYLMDGKVLVSSGSITTIIDVPYDGDDRKPAPAPILPVAPPTPAPQPDAASEPSP